MITRIGPRIVAVLVVAVVAVIVYQQTIPVTTVVRARLSRLVVVKTGLSGYAPAAATAEQIPNASSPFAAVKAAAKTRPGGTGGYVRGWKSPTSKYKVAQVLTEWVPTVGVARTAAGQAATEYLARTAYSSSSLAYKSALTVPTIAGSHGAVFSSKATKTDPATTLVVTVFQQGTDVVVVSTLGTDPARTQDDNLALARHQDAHLTAIGPGFSLQRTTRPALATALFAAAAVVVALIAVALVGLVPRELRRRRARRMARARYEVQVKGQTITKRHRTPMG
jgi:hypothetical protein